MRGGEQSFQQPRPLAAPCSLPTTGCRAFSGPSRGSKPSTDNAFPTTLSKLDIGGLGVCGSEGSQRWRGGGSDLGACGGVPRLCSCKGNSQDPLECSRFCGCRDSPRPSLSFIVRGQGRRMQLHPKGRIHVGVSKGLTFV